MGTRWPLSGQMAFDNNGVRAPAAVAYFYSAGTTTPYVVYQDAGETTPHLDPVVADGNGRWPQVYVPFGSYKEVIKTSGGTTLSTADEIPNPAPVDTSASVDANAIFQTGDMILLGKNGTRDGFVRCNGRTIGNASSSATERANADTATLFAHLWDNFADGQCAVSGGRGATAVADYAANKRIALPDFRGASPFGFDDMGNTAASLMGSAPVVSGSAILAGSIIGANTHTITTSHMPSHTHAVTGVTVGGAGSHTHTATTTTTGSAHGHTVNVTDPGHTHTSGSTGFVEAGGAANLAGIGAGAVLSIENTTASATTGITAATTGSDGTHTHTISTTSDPGNHVHALSGTVDANGSGTAHNIVSRGVPVTVLMKL
jgi:hypothetical protein